MVFRSFVTGGLLRGYCAFFFNFDQTNSAKKFAKSPQSALETLRPLPP
jgi:hypothetical protein